MQVQKVKDQVAQTLQVPILENFKALDDLIPGNLSFEVRFELMVPTGLLECCSRILKRRAELNNPDINGYIWRWLWTFVTIDNLDDPRERGPGSSSDLCQKMGFMELCKIELVETLKGKACMYAMNFIQRCCHDESMIPMFVSLGMHKELIRRINDGILVSAALSALRSLTLMEEARSVIRSDGGLDAVIPNLEELTYDVASPRGCDSASIFARLAGNDENGVGPQILRGNPAIVKSFLVALQKMLDNGANGSWGVPHEISSDVLVIAASDANKPLLVEGIPVFYSAVELRGGRNPKLVHDIVKILLLLSYDSACKLAMVEMGEVRLKAMATFISTADSLEVRIAHTNLLLVLFPQVQTKQPLMQQSLSKQAEGKGFFPRRLFGTKNKNAITVIPPLDVSDKHIMISYNWGTKNLAMHLLGLLKQKGIPTWIDEENMGTNIADSMASAVENAKYTLVLVTQKYKESGNCRLECEYSHVKGVPLVFILAQSRYQPDGWLGLLMGNSLYIPMSSVSQANANFSQVLVRIGVGKKEEEEIAEPSTMEFNDSSEVIALLTAKLDALQDTVDKMQKQIETNTLDIHGVKEDVKKALSA